MNVQESLIMMITMLTTRWKSCGGCWRGYSARAGEATHQFVIEFQNRTKCTLQCRVCINNKHSIYLPPNPNFVEIIQMLSRWPAICSCEFSTFHIAVYLIWARWLAENSEAQMPPWHGNLYDSLIFKQKSVLDSLFYINSRCRQCEPSSCFHIVLTIICFS